MVMSSFFVLTVSLTRKPDSSFESFFSRRLKRLWIPLFVWTFVYSLSEALLFPTLLGAESFGGLPPAAVFFTGYRHLWFIQFIFVGSLIIYPLIKRLTDEQSPAQIKLSTFCFGLSILYGLLFYSFLQNYTDWDNLSPEFDMSLRIFVSQAGNYIFYIPVAVGLALGCGKINELFARRPISPPLARRGFNHDAASRWNKRYSAHAGNLRHRRLSGGTPAVEENFF
jgi:hypothetical protein